MVTMNELIFDVLNQLYGGVVHSGAEIPSMQVRKWILQFRALFLKREVDKGRLTEPMQQLISVDTTFVPGTSSFYESSKVLPDFIRSRNLPVVSYVGTGGPSFQIIQPHASFTKKYSPASSGRRRAYISDGRLYVTGPQENLTMPVLVRGLFEDPQAAHNFNLDFVSPSRWQDDTTPFPISEELAAAVVSAVVKTAGITESAQPKDLYTDNKSDTTGRIRSTGNSVAGRLPKQQVPQQQYIDETSISDE